MEKYRKLGEPVYVAFVHISNAFPTTNRDILWIELHKRGGSALICDWLRLLYTNTRCIVREVTYVEVSSASAKASICVPLYKVTRNKASWMAWAIMGVNSVLKDMPPAGARLLYTAQVDALLSAAADVVPDMDCNIAMLEKV
ncbi:unnamed protein product [Peniophora sp. CBMAI 1063]|nr:unnamed protein product [Peniophora sp. CBMAI 1063]